jgi:hypothetical protein
MLQLYLTLVVYSMLEYRDLARHTDRQRLSHVNVFPHDHDHGSLGDGAPFAFT